MICSGGEDGSVSCWDDKSIPLGLSRYIGLRADQMDVTLRSEPGLTLSFPCIEPAVSDEREMFLKKWKESTKIDTISIVFRVKGASLK
ncbi:unnamed protein product [Allacma fusca]|uniref:Uncharacterized protein n=1 Tax=Allacma fusca TaxID=39272 RepID=A0A8J2JSU4_9HEXA|nr:unnamed protein product [Allacma fusca]